MAINLLVVCGLLAALPASAAAEPRPTPVPGLSGCGRGDPAGRRRRDVDRRARRPRRDRPRHRGRRGDRVPRRRDAELHREPGAERRWRSPRHGWPVGRVVPDAGGGDELGRITTDGAVGRYALSDGRADVARRRARRPAVDDASRATPAIPTRSPAWTRPTRPRRLHCGPDRAAPIRARSRAGPDGALWFVESGGSGRLGRITTAGELTLAERRRRARRRSPPARSARSGSRAAPPSFRLSDPTPFSTGAATTALAAGPDGALWGAMTGARGAHRARRRRDHPPRTACRRRARQGHRRRT